MSAQLEPSAIRHQPLRASDPKLALLRKAIRAGGRRADAAARARSVLEEYLAMLAEQFADGDPRALLEAQRLCARNRLVLPEWASSAVAERLTRVLNGDVRTLDEAFGRPHGKHAQIAKTKDHARLAVAIYWRIREEGQTRPIDVALFGMVGREFGCRSTKCAKYYREGKALYARLPPTFRQLLERAASRDAARS